VEGQQDAVGGGPGVSFQVGVAEADGVLEGSPGILRVMRRPAPVREGNGEGAVKVGNGTAFINVCSQHAAQYPASTGALGEQGQSSRRDLGVMFGGPAGSGLPFPAPGIRQRDTGRDRHVQRADPAHLRNVGGPGAGGEQRG